MLHFNDGISIDTSGEPRLLELADGVYVVGKGMLIPVADAKEGDKIVREMTKEGGEEA